MESSGLASWGVERFVENLGKLFEDIYVRAGRACRGNLNCWRRGVDSRRAGLERPLNPLKIIRADCIAKYLSINESNFISAENEANLEKNRGTAVWRLFLLEEEFTRPFPNFPRKCRQI